MAGRWASLETRRPRRVGGIGLVLVIVGGAVGCAPVKYRKEADAVVARIIPQKQGEALGRTEPFTIDTPANTLRRRLIETQQLQVSGPASIGSDELPLIEHWPEDGPVERAPDIDPLVEVTRNQAVKLSLLQALQIAARNSRDYQFQKESVFLAALDLDLEIDRFRNTYTGMLDGLLSIDLSDGGDARTGLENTNTASVSRQLESGATLAGSLVLDLVKILSGEKDETLGILADFSVTIPLLRGSGRHIVTEPLTQAERDVIYAIWTFERFKRTFAVSIATNYLNAIEQLNQVDTSADAYRRSIVTTRRQQKLAEAGRVSQTELDQAIQAELRDRNSWISSLARYQATLDGFKLMLGLPTDGIIELDRGELANLAEGIREVLARSLGTSGESAGPVAFSSDPTLIELVEPTREGGGQYEMAEEAAIAVALENRLDLRTREGRVFDAQRAIVVAADGFKPDLDLTAGASFGDRRSIGSAATSSARLRPEVGAYDFTAELDLPWERTRERNVYRGAFINLEDRVRDVQELEDQVKRDIRDALRDLILARESYKIQVAAVEVAERRVERENLMLEAGRAQTRDLLEAQADLTQAQNNLTSAMVDYRVTELNLQRDMGVLVVDEKGLWREYQPPTNP